MEKKRRIFFLDNLKAFIVCLMIVFHAAMCYMAYAPEWWYTVDKADPKFAFTLLVLWADIFIMPVMFFISGYFGIMSLSKQTGAQFWKSKLLRIVLHEQKLRGNKKKVRLRLLFRLRSFQLKTGKHRHCILRRY